MADLTARAQAQLDDMDAAGLFEPLLGPNDAIISDSLNNASIIQGVRPRTRARRSTRPWRRLPRRGASICAARPLGSA